VLKGQASYLTTRRLKVNMFLMRCSLTGFRVDGRKSEGLDYHTVLLELAEWIWCPILNHSWN